MMPNRSKAAALCVAFLSMLATDTRAGPTGELDVASPPRQRPGRPRPRGADTRAPARAAKAEGSSKKVTSGSFGPSYIIESIEIRGNEQTVDSVIERQIDFKKGDSIHAADPKVLAAKYRLLGLGYFRRVNLRLKRGSRKGYVVLVVEVRERGTIWINSLFFGASEATDFWGGIDVSENNFLGRGIVLSGAFVIGTKADVPGSRLQHAERIRFSDQYFLGSEFGLSLTLLHVDASEFFRTSGETDSSSPGNFVAAGYRRYGGTLGTSVDLGRWNRVSLHLRWEGIESDLPVGKVRRYPDGTTAGIEYFLDPGQSYLTSLMATFTRDKRNDPILPSSGYRLDVTGEIASELLGSSYSFAKVVGRFQKWWPLPKARHSISLHLLGGMIVGRAPLFDKFFVGDLNDLLPRRALGLNFSTLPSRNLFRTNADTLRYEDVAAKVGVEYSITLFRNKSFVYRGNFFINAGVFALFSREHIRQRESSLDNAIPIDMTLDVGVRFDTRIGVFSVSVANALGRLPL